MDLVRIEGSNKFSIKHVTILIQILGPIEGKLLNLQKIKYATWYSIRLDTLLDLVFYVMLNWGHIIYLFIEINKLNHPQRRF